MPENGAKYTPGPLVFGEVLFDSFADGQEVLGGAPFNVAWHLCGFGLAPLMISRVGADSRGEAVLATMRRWGMSTEGIQIDHDRPTGLVTCTVAGGNTSFEIQSDQAYDFIDDEAARAATAEIDAPVFYHGTLALRSEASHTALTNLRDSIAAPVFVDVNLRPPWWRLETVLDCLGGARWAKVNEEELAEILSRELDRGNLVSAAGELATEHLLGGVIVTRGEHGALWVEASGVRHDVTPEPVTDFVDAVGAGDAFAAVAVLGLLRGWPVATVLERATAFAAEICRRQGATTFDPQLYEHTQGSWYSYGADGET